MISSRHHLEARQVARVIVAVEMNERFGGAHTDLTSAPLRHDERLIPRKGRIILQIGLASDTLVRRAYCDRLMSA